MIEVPTVYGNTITLYFNYQESISDSCPSLMCFITFYYKKHTTGGTLMNQKYLDKLLLDMTLKNFTQSTMEGYHCYVRIFLEYIHKDAMLATYTDIRKFIFYLKDQGGKMPSTINCYTAALKFFFEYTLGFQWNSKKVPKMKRDKKLPVILSREEVNFLIDSFDNLKHKAMVSTMYSSGLRVSEVCRLRYEDIRRSQSMIYVSRSKNRQDRYSILSGRNLELLTDYWYNCGRPTDWLFPSQVTGGPLTNDSIRLTISGQAEKIGLKQHVTPHTMRHSFAVHLLEDGVSHTVIQQLLGHCSPTSTDVYLQMTSKVLMGIHSPYDRTGGSNE